MVHLVLERKKPFRELLTLLTELSGMTQGLMYPIPAYAGLHISTVISKAATLVEKWLAIRASMLPTNYSTIKWNYLKVEINRFNRIFDNIQWNMQASTDSPISSRDRLVGAQTLMCLLESEIKDFLPSPPAP